STATVDNLEQTQDYIEAAKKVMKIMSLIIDVKVEMSDYMGKNADIYGRYTSTKLLKEEIIAELNSIAESKVALADDFLKNINQINKDLPKKEIKRVTKLLSKTFKSEMKNFNKREKKLRKRKNRITRVFTRALRDWSPYQDHMKSLEDLRDSLIIDLEKMKEVLNMTDEEIDIIITTIEVTSKPTASQSEFCKNMSSSIEMILRNIDLNIVIDPYGPRPTNPGINYLRLNQRR
ncbi:MAG: hypothetical protein ACI9QD_000386, partial [Thermoproteota archaeon]